MPSRINREQFEPQAVTDPAALSPAVQCVPRAASIHPLWGLLEITVLALVFFAGLWLAGPRIGSLPHAKLGYWLLVAWGGVYLLWISPVLLHCDPPEWRGWGGRRSAGPAPGSWGRAWPSYAALTAAGAALLLAYAWWQDPGHVTQINWREVQIKFAGYVVFGIVQDAVFFGFVLVRFRQMIPLIPGPHAVRRHQAAVALATALVFAGFHFPNPALMGFTLAGGFCWSWLFYRRPNILLLGLGHAVLGTILHRIVHLYMRNGPFYAQPDLHILRHVVPGLQRFAGHLF